MKLKVKKWIRDKQYSKERNRKGELEMLKTDPLRGRVDMFIADRDPLGEVADCCEHKLTLGCDLPIGKRNKPECRCCL